MEFMDGGSLYDWLHSDLDIAWDVRLRYEQDTFHTILITVLSINDYIMKREVTGRKEQYIVTKTEHTGWPNKQPLV